MATTSEIIARYKAEHKEVTTEQAIRNMTAFLCNYALDNFCKVTRNGLFDFVMGALNEENSWRDKIDVPEDCRVFMDVARWEEFEGKYSIEGIVREYTDKFYSLWF